MKIIERYVFKAFLSSFLLAFVVLSFVLTIGLLVQIIGYIMDGVPMSLVGEFCMVSLPETLQWSMPLALLVSSILVFSRLSADSEIAAMRACGVSIISVIKWPVAFGLVCTLLGFWVNNEIVPRGHEVRRNLKTKVSVGTGLSVLEPGRVISDFPKVKIYFAKKEGNWLYDLVVLDYSNPKIDRMITASRALVVQDGADVNLDLYNMTVEPVDENHHAMARANRFVYKMEDVIKNKEYRRKDKDFRFFEMLKVISDFREKIAEARADTNLEKTELKFLKRAHSATLVEFNKRFVFAMASICFVLIGIPLGVRSHRKESTIGMAISLAVSLGYYLVVILALSLEKNYQFQPEFLIWLPIVVCFVLSAKLIKKNL